MFCGVLNKTDHDYGQSVNHSTRLIWDLGSGKFTHICHVGGGNNNHFGFSSHPNWQILGHWVWVGLKLAWKMVWTLLQALGTRQSVPWKLFSVRISLIGEMPSFHQLLIATLCPLFPMLPPNS